MWPAKGKRNFRFSPQETQIFFTLFRTQAKWENYPSRKLFSHLAPRRGSLSHFYFRDTKPKRSPKSSQAVNDFNLFPTESTIKEIVPTSKSLIIFHQLVHSLSQPGSRYNTLHGAPRPSSAAMHSAVSGPTNVADYSGESTQNRRQNSLLPSSTRGPSFSLSTSNKNKGKSVDICAAVKRDCQNKF